MDRKYLLAYYESFIVVLILSWLPFKSVSYVAPFLVLTWFIIRANSGRTLLKLALVIAACIAIVGLYVVLSRFLGIKYLVQNSVLALITYGSFFFLLVSPSKIATIDETFYLKIRKIIGTVICVEAIIGIFQYLIVVSTKGLSNSSGDVVQGTIYLLSFRESTDMGFGNQIFTINMSLMILFYLPYVLNYRKGYLTALLGVASLLLALVSHVIIPLFLSVCILLILFRKRIIGKLKSKHLIFTFALVIILALIYRLQNELVTHYIDKFVKVESPKAKVTFNSVKGIAREYPSSIFIGLGPGQFSSRASLIATGRYIGGLNNQRSLPFISPDMTDAFRIYIYPEYVEYLTNPKYGFSTMSRPFHSMLSIYIEFGTIFFTGLISMVLYLLFRLRKFYLLSIKTNKTLNTNIAFVCGAVLLTIFFISFFENYLEMTQAIFPGLILFKMFYLSLKKMNQLDKEILGDNSI